MTNKFSLKCYPAPRWDRSITRLTRGANINPPPISETTRPIFKSQTAFDSPAKVAERNLILLTSGSPMTSQVRSKKKYRHLEHVHLLVAGDR